MKLFLAVIAFAALTMAEETSVQTLLNQGNDQFTAKMFSEVTKKNPGKSVVMSAFSVLTPLAQLSLASVGQSHDELLRAIGLPNDNATKEVFTYVNTQLRNIKGVDLRQASRVYIPEGYELNDNFATVSRDVFNSDVKNVDFTKNQETATAINTWVEDQTNHRIKDLVDPDSLDATTRAVLVNAIYFKGTWKDKFDAAETMDRDFHVTKDETVKVPTMHIRREYLYGESADLDAKLLRIPYEGDESYFLVVLPNAIDGLAALEEKLKDPAALQKAVQSMYTYEVDVYLPKFKIETTTNLKEVLENMDVKSIFSSNAKLDNLLKGESDLYVSEAIQKAFIEVNEEGAEAAAANEIIINDRVGSIGPDFIADRPFYFELNIHNHLLFNGVFVT